MMHPHVVLRRLEYCVLGSMYGQQDHSVSYYHGLIVRQRRHRNKPKFDKMLSSRELSAIEQVHDACRISNDTPFYLLSVNANQT